MGSAYYIRIAALIVFMIGWGGVSFANEIFSRPNLELAVGAENFRWKEFDTNDNRILEESGSRLFVAGILSGFQRSDSGFVYQARVKGYQGSVNYDGETQPPASVPVESDTNYTGVEVELLGGYRWLGLVGNALDLTASAGVDAWDREIEDSLDALGNNVTGILENYRINYARVGLGIEHSMPSWRGYLRFGAKRSVTTDETVDSLNLSLEPGKSWSPYVEYRLMGVTNRPGDGGNMVLTLFYDGFNFRRSAANNGYLQPKSKMSIIGVSIGKMF